MAMRASRTQRRNQVLSRERIIATAVDLLDAGGENALTVRALTEALNTGAGAIYYHVGARDEMLEAVAESVITDALATEPDDAAASPADAIRAIALALFDAIAEHQWLATRLTLQIVRNPVGPVAIELFERIGKQVGALGVPQHRWFDAASTILHYILGAVSQNARLEGDTSGIDPTADREEFFVASSNAWRELDPTAHPFMHAIVDQMRQHDDREQFVAGIAVVLAGLVSLR